MNNCSVKCNDTSIVFTDGGGKSKMIFQNKANETLTKIKVDGCLIKDGKRCDFLLITSGGQEHFIELKGKKVGYACEQIETSINQISKDIKALKYAFIVSSACPLTTTEVQIFKVKFKKKLNTILTVKNKECCHHL